MRGPIKINRTHLRTAIRICSLQKTAKAIASLRVLRALSQSPRAAAATIATQSGASRSQVFNLVQRVNAKEFERLWRYGNNAKQRVSLDRSPLRSKVLSGLTHRLAVERDRLGLAPNRRRVVGADGKSKRRPHPVLRIEAVIELRSTQKSIASIAKQLQCTTRDVRNWGILYQTKGLTGLCDERTGRPPTLRAASNSNHRASVIRTTASQPIQASIRTFICRDSVETALKNLLKSAWNECKPDLDRRYVLLQGLRGVGKTAVAQSLFADDATFLDCEDAATRRKLNSPETTFANVKQRTVVLDEIGQLENPHRVLAAIRDAPHIRRMLAISSSSLRPQPIGDIIHPHPHPLHRLQMQPLLWEERRALVAAQHGVKPFEVALVAPGLPGLSLHPAPKIDSYREWARGVIARDLKGACGCDYTKLLQLIETLMAQSGGIFAPQEIGERCGLSGEAIQESLRGLIDAGLFAVVPLNDGGRDDHALVYAADTGFVHAVQSTIGSHLSPQIQQESLWRHLVLSQLRQGLESPDQVSTWRSKVGEPVDFVFEAGGSQWTAIQCAWSGEGRMDGFKAFRRVHPLGRNLVISPRLATTHNSEGSFKYTVCQPVFMAGLLRSGFNSIEAYRSATQLMLENAMP